MNQYLGLIRVGPRSSAANFLQRCPLLIVGLLTLPQRKSGHFHLHVRTIIGISEPVDNH
jgi:hypothetical protein